MAKVSVVTLTYQHAPFIETCIRSVLAQTMPDWEMVIIDDGSNDGTADIAESFDDPRITVLRQAHAGVAGLGRAYAAAVAASTGPFIAILEGDDTWPATKLADQLPLFDDPAVVVTYGSAGLMDEQGCVYAHFSWAPGEGVANNDPVGSILPAMVNNNFMVAVTVMVRRSALERIGGFLQPDGIPYVDHPTWLRLAAVGTFARSSRVLGYWRRHSRQITTRRWFDGAPDRAAYLRSAAEDARDLLTPDVIETLAASIRRDPARQHEEALLAQGRMALIEGEWREAASRFARIARTGEPRTRAVAVAGLLCAAVRTDLERPIRALGRHSLPSRRHLASHPEPGPASEAV